MILSIGFSFTGKQTGIFLHADENCTNQMLAQSLSRESM